SAAEFHQGRPSRNEFCNICTTVTQNADFATSRIIFGKLGNTFEQLRSDSIVKVFCRHMLGNGAQAFKYIGFKLGNVDSLRRETLVGYCCDHECALTRIRPDARYLIASVPMHKRSYGN